jgi:hypothetical protein
VKAALLVFFMLLSVSATAEEQPYFFSWANRQSPRETRVTLKCSPKTCMGQVFRDGKVLLTSELPLTESTGTVRRLADALAGMPASCPRKRPNSSPDPVTFTWKLRYFDDFFEGESLAEASRICAASELTARAASTLIYELTRSTRAHRL